MDIHLCNHKFNSRHKARRNKTIYLLMFFGGGE